MKQIITALLFAAALMVSTGCTRTIAVYSPDFSVNSQSQAKLSQAIKKSLQDRKWILVKEEPGKYIARYDRGSKYSATIQISFAKGNVSIRLVDSLNLQHGYNDKGEEVIHKTYIGWIRNLERDIQYNLSYS